MVEGLIERLEKAVKCGEVSKRFTKEDVKAWVADNDIRKSNGQVYARLSIGSILHNSDKDKRRGSNKNRKVLRSEKVGRDLFYEFV